MMRFWGSSQKKNFLSKDGAVHIALSFQSVKKVFFLVICLLETAPPQPLPEGRGNIRRVLRTLHPLSYGVLLAIYGGLGAIAPEKATKSQLKRKNLVRRCAARHTRWTGVFRQAEVLVHIPCTDTFHCNQLIFCWLQIYFLVCE